MIYKELKNEILSKLDFLSDKISYKNIDREILVLNSIHHSKNYRYQLSVTLEVTKRIGEKGIEVDKFKIQGIDLFRGNGEDAAFQFTKKEIYNYIDFI